MATADATPDAGELLKPSIRIPQVIARRYAQAPLYSPPMRTLIGFAHARWNRASPLEPKDARQSASQMGAACMGSCPRQR